MINPAEEIVNVWLQECCKRFVMSNIVVHKKTRKIKGRKVGGGRGKEIDFFSTDGEGNYFWTEVSVSPSPRLPGGKKSMRIIKRKAVRKFADEKEKWLKDDFTIKRIKRQFIYSPKMFTRKGNQEKTFREFLRKKKIETVSFGLVLEQVFSKLNFMGYDAPRQYLFLLKKFGYRYQE